MECPPGMRNVTPEDVLALLKCIYGLVQAARQYHKKFVHILTKKLGFKAGEVDPCLLIRRDEKGLVYVAIYVDDNLIVGHPEAIDDVIQGLKDNGLILKVEDTLHDYLSCEVKFSDDMTRAWLGQPHLISKLEKTFGDEVKGLREYKTPGTPNQYLIRNTDPAMALDKQQHKRFRSGVGMLLWLVKHSRPDIANAVRELSKVLDGTTEMAYKELLQAIKYVLDSKTMGLRIEPTFKKGEPWELVCFTDSDYAGDPDSRRSVSGYILYVCGVPIIWRSKMQQSVTLSSSEAEWVSLSEAVKEIMFVLHLLEFMGIKVQYPVTVRVDNIGTIFMSTNLTTMGRTKHVDVRTKYVREYVKDDVLKLIFVKFEDNDSHIMTKNYLSDLQKKHSSRIVKRK
ncbi:hypothetical protein ACHAWF_005014 [Thalassiosira exigua]